jgi:hypothetical protein
MKKIILFFLSLFLMSTSSYADVYDSVAEHIASNLHIVSGSIVEVDKNKVTLNKGYQEGIYKNSIVYIYRNQGKLALFKNNETVELKKGVAYAYVSDVKDNTSTALIADGIDKEKNYLLGLGIIPWGEKTLIGTPKPNDSFIAGKKQFRVAIVTRNAIIYSSLKSALEKTNRFYVISPDELAIALTKKRINSVNEKDSIVKLSKAVNADIVMLVSAPKYNTLNCRVYNGYAGRVILSLKEKIDNNSKTVLINNKNSNKIPANNLVASNLRLSQKLTFWESLLDQAGLYSPYSGLDMSSDRYKIITYKNIGYGTTAMFVGNINRTDNKNVMIARGSNIDIYSFDSDSFSKMASFTYGYNVFNIDSANINGKILIAISNFNRYGTLDSCVGYIDKDFKFHIIKGNLPYHVRFYDRFNNPVLIAQTATVSKPFSGNMYTINLKTDRIEKFSLPVQADSFYDFEKIDNSLAYLSRSGQLKVYSFDDKKIKYKSSFALGRGNRYIQRYDYETNNQESIHEVEAKNNVYIKKGVKFFKSKDGCIYALGKRNYVSKVITINEQHYNAYSLKLLKFTDNKFEEVWSSGDVKGRVVDAGKIGEYIVSVIGLPAGFFDRFIRGIEEIDRLSVAEIMNN